MNNAEHSQGGEAPPPIAYLQLHPPLLLFSPLETQMPSREQRSKELRLELQLTLAECKNGPLRGEQLHLVHPRHPWKTVLTTYRSVHVNGNYISLLFFGFLDLLFRIGTYPRKSPVAAPPSCSPFRAERERKRKKRVGGEGERVGHKTQNEGEV